MSSIRFLPVEWHSVIHTRDDAVKRQLEAITLPSVPILRNNDLTFIIRYPGRAGSMTNDCISDVLFYQGSEYQYKIREEVVQNINNTIPARERLSFGLHCRVACLFLIGSPVALFLTCRGSCANIIPEVPDYGGGGGVRAHVQLKGVMKALADSAYDVATKDGGIKKAFIAPMKSLLGLDADEIASLQTAIESIKTINGGERIDWELQETLIESANDYVTAVVSHNRYFNHVDFAAFVKDKLTISSSSSAA
ncbi:hypothetical protein Pmar_PMAR010175 [Perkinsus marinus ATCC 50983]|uniref:DDHD domain-containing protein n=1 Tax=Perkinsus marinus (strain ATCC 50983 / TXsc) TaxID=423536 RepID=C5K514_PERM5|nr:hypothetical protein Pmar_PMAR010175 [Perkinsus marinus ATCC 50983]EER20436.1 hypothetical protein Pmar_PMAR010175 [Perkinsus marinus ATCC 50983]|eukprot:XP_002788640.1 hypothetical protein Pmar_PMAR010175 [Perkinsus marinus ATCC 50983]